MCGVNVTLNYFYLECGTELELGDRNIVIRFSAVKRTKKGSKRALVLTIKSLCYLGNQCTF